MKTLIAGAVSSVLGSFAFAMLSNGTRLGTLPTADRAFYGGTVGVLVALGVFLLTTRLLGSADGGLPQDSVLRFLFAVSFLAVAAVVGLFIGDGLLLLVRRYLLGEWCTFASADQLSTTFASLPMFAAIVAGQLFIIRSLFGRSSPDVGADAESALVTALRLPFAIAALIFPFALSAASLWALATYAIPGFAGAVYGPVGCSG